MEIKFEQVSYCYNQDTPHAKVALKEVSFTIGADQITGIIGKSGSGKTTLIQLMNGLLIPTSGTVQIGEFSLSRNQKIRHLNELRKEVGLVFQFPEEQFFHSTVEKEVGFALHNFGYPKEKISKHILDALYMVGLDETYLKRDPFRLSNGEKRKVAIASILAYNPHVIIFDEPTIGLDHASKLNLIKILRKLKTKFHKTIVVVSHDVDFLHSFVDQMVVLSHGEVVITGKKYDVFKQDDILKNAEIEKPKVILFSDNVKKCKQIRLGYRDDIKDLIKDIYRYAK